MRQEQCDDCALAEEAEAQTAKDSDFKIETVKCPDCGQAWKGAFLKKRRKRGRRKS